MSAEKVVALAKSQVGITEYPEGSGITKYGVDFGDRKSPWDVSFLWWVFLGAGEGFALFGGAKPTRRDALLRWYTEMGWTAEADSAQPGDIVVLNPYGTDESLRYALVVKTLGTGRYETVQGDCEAGVVSYHIRYANELTAVLRPKYEHSIDEEMKEVEDDEDY